VPSLDDAVAAAATLRRWLPGVHALEVMDGESLRLVTAATGTPVPVGLREDAGAFLLVEVAGAADPTESLGAALTELRVEALDAAVATTRPERERLWRFREAHPEVAATLGVVHKYDVTLPTAALADFCVTVRAEIGARWPAATTLVYGHVGDGNVHVNTVGAGDTDEVELDELVLGLVVARGGSISAEHGVGVAKRRWLPLDRSAAEIDAMRAIKAALDPDGILNPGILLP
jgi:FAD/FMN-containing dehydrogenase